MQYTLQPNWIKAVQSPLTQVLDAAARRGKLNLRSVDIAHALPGASAVSKCT